MLSVIGSSAKADSYYYSGAFVVERSQYSAKSWKNRKPSRPEPVNLRATLRRAGVRELAGLTQTPRVQEALAEFLVVNCKNIACFIRSFILSRSIMWFIVTFCG